MRWTLLAVCACLVMEPYGTQEHATIHFETG